jgi:hypothetical protein
MSLYQVHLDDLGEARIEHLKTEYGLDTDRAVFDLALSLAVQLADHIDGDGCLTVLNGSTSVSIKVKDVVAP